MTCPKECNQSNEIRKLCTPEYAMNIRSAGRLRVVFLVVQRITIIDSPSAKAENWR